MIHLLFIFRLSEKRKSEWDSGAVNVIWPFIRENANYGIRKEIYNIDDEKNTPHVCGNIIHVKIERLKRPWQTSVEIATVYSRALHTTIAAV